jgi:hypothetical protein
MFLRDLISTLLDNHVREAVFGDSFYVGHEGGRIDPIRYGILPKDDGHPVMNFLQLHGRLSGEDCEDRVLEAGIRLLDAIEAGKPGDLLIPGWMAYLSLTFRRFPTCI